MRKKSQKHSLSSEWKTWKWNKQTNLKISHALGISSVNQKADCLVGAKCKEKLGDKYAGWGYETKYGQHGAESSWFGR